MIDVCLPRDGSDAQTSPGPVSLLPDGRHILTAAHNFTTRGTGKIVPLVQADSFREPLCR